MLWANHHDGCSFAHERIDANDAYRFLEPICLLFAIGWHSRIRLVTCGLKALAYQVRHVDDANLGALRRRMR